MYQIISGFTYQSGSFLCHLQIKNNLFRVKRHCLIKGVGYEMARTESISMQKRKILLDEESNQNVGQLFSVVKVRFYCFSLRVFVGGVAFTSFFLTTHRNNSEIDDFHQLSLLHWHIIINFTPCGDILDTQHNTNSCLMLLALFALRYEAALTPWFLNIILYVGIKFFFFRFFAFFISEFWAPVF